MYGEGINDNLGELLEEFTQVSIRQKAQQMKSILDKKQQLDYSDKQDYMTEGQVLEFISKWEYK